ncbi:hypothetical protein Poly59_53340 [Rubripirellula reticaptiva]|uniref:Uncharacterized protein n=2 Tax=Rubripirellula reticaptiva TaxID=2528013 RepID=A0A5C6EBM8_9BACT|nr:hypothetical protein Poly59_53340 [Rubripirellula reticaptiva]
MLAIGWVAGEANDTPWLRRVTAPLFTLAACGIVAAYCTLATSFDNSIRYSGAIKQFISAVIETSERDGNDAALDQLRQFDSDSIETYQGGALLEWLAAPIVPDPDSPENDG